MKRNALLIVVEQFKRGGLETHIESEVRTLTALGWDVYMALSECHSTASLPRDLKGILTGIDLGPLATSRQLLLAVETLGRFIERNAITAVHCHPFTSSLAAFLAAGRSRVGLAFTLHGPASVGAHYGDVFEAFFRHYILPQSGLVVCVSQEVSQLARFAGTSSATVVLPNPISLGPPAERLERDGGPLRIACVSRLDEEKIPGIEDLISKLPAGTGWQLDVIGSGQSDERLAAFVAANAFAPQIVMRGWSDELDEALHRYDLVAGMGRVVLEASAANIPALLVGYDGVKGVLDPNAFRSAAYANFSGRGLATIDADELAEQVAQLHSGQTSVGLRHLVEWDYAETNVWGAFAAKVLQAVPSSRRSIDLMIDTLVQTCDSELPLLQNPLIAELLGDASKGDDVSLRVGSAELTLLSKETKVLSELDSGSGGGDVLLREIASLRSLLQGLQTRLGDDDWIAALDETKQSFLSTNTAFSTLTQKVKEIQDADAAHRAERGADRRQFERIEQDWRTLGMRLLEHVGAADATMRSLISQVEQGAMQTFERAADDRWRAFVEEIKSQHAREVALIEREAERREALLLERAAATGNQLEISRELWDAEEARLRAQLAEAALMAESLQAEIEALNSSLEASKLEASVREKSQPAKPSKDEHSTQDILLASSDSMRALQQIVVSLEARGAVQKREICELRARSAFKDVEARQAQDHSPDQASCFGIPGLVSIVLPVYNQANLIDEAIDGVLSQTYPHWELIVIDDGSSDDLQSVVTKYKTDKRIFVAHQPNQKLPSALNNGNQLARGSYITWTSADNIMLPNQLAELVVALEGNPDAGLAYSDYQAIDDRGEPLNEPDWRRHNRPDGSSDIRLPSEVTLDNFHHSGDNFLGASFLWRADVQAIVGPYDESTFGGEDYDMWLRMHLVTEFVHVPKVLYKYRVHDNTLNAKAKELDLFKNIRLLLETNQRRREILLRDQKLLPGIGDHLRDPRQYAAAVTSDREFLTYFELVAKRMQGELLDDRIRVVIVDAPLRVLDTSVLGESDIIVVADALTFSWLRQQPLPRHIRLLAGDLVSARAAVDHAIALCHFDKALVREGHILANKPAAQPIARIGEEGIALILQRWGIGGMEQVVLELATGLTAKGARVSVCLVEGGPHAALSQEAERHGFSIVTLGGEADRLVSHCRAENVGIAHYHHCSFGSRDLAAAGVRTVYTFHNSYIWQKESERSSYAASLGAMNAFIAVSREAASFGRNALKLHSPVFVVPNGTNLKGAGANALEGSGLKLPDPRADGCFGYLAVGTLTPHKLHDRLIRAFDKVAMDLPSARLTIVGSAQDESAFRRLLELRNGLKDPSACTIIPGVERQDVIRLMHSHHCLVMPSLIEGWSISLLEAALAGMVCIASDVGSARDLSQRTRSVVLAPSPGGDVLDLHAERMWAAIKAPMSGFEAALGRLMVETFEKFDDLDAAARNAVPELAKEFSLDAMVEAHLHVYQQI